VKKVLSLFVLLVFASLAFANGVSLNSPGTRAISMGGAYIAHVNDYSTPYWNPGGLVNVSGMQATIFITDIIPSATYKYEYALAGINVNAKSKAQHLIAPNAAFLWKCMLYDKLHLGLSLIVPAGLGVEWDGKELADITGGTAYDWSSSIQVINISLSGAMKFGDKLNAGLAFHLVNGSMAMDKPAKAQVPSSPPTYVYAQYSETSDGWGYGLGFGAQYMLTEKLTLGAALRTKMTVKFEGEAENPLLAATGSTKSDFDRDITWPLWIGGGAAYKLNEKLLLAFDAQWSQWEETEEQLVAEYDNALWESTLAANGNNTIHLNWKSQVQLRLGAEYLMNEKLALRAGFYLDPAPGPDETQTILIPNTDFTGLCFGFGYKINEKLSCDFGFEYLIGAEREIDPADVMLNPLNPDPYNPLGMAGKHGLSIAVPSIAVTDKF